MNKTLWIMCGVPGSGKTWFAKNKLSRGSGWGYVSRDSIRFSIIKDNEDYFSHEDEVFETFVKTIVFMINYEGTNNIIADATHLNWSSRRKLLNALSKEIDMGNVDVIPVFMEVKMKDILERNNLREGRAQVPEKTIYDMYNRMSNPERDPYNYTAVMKVKN